MPQTRQYGVSRTTDVTIVTTAEIVVLTITGVVIEPGQVAHIHGWADVNAGTAATGLIMNVRRDSLTGSKVQEDAFDEAGVAAGIDKIVTTDVEDSFTGEVAGQTYVLTLDQVAATGNGTVTSCAMTIDVF